MFEYFPDNYNWSLATVLALGMGGELSEIDDACRGLRPLAATEDEAALAAWFEAWTGIARRATEIADADLAEGHGRSAGRKYRRAAVYHLMAERMMTNLSPRKRQSYDEALRVFGLAVELLGEPVEFVEVPFEGVSLPGLFVPAQGVEGPAPCLIMLNGYDVVKEILYLTGTDELARRGVSVLFVDHPGTGGALRLHDLPARVETEQPVAACVDYLEGRADVDGDRVAVGGISMGGYYAPRAASFEPRIKACVAWGACHDVIARNEWAMATETEKKAESAPAFQVAWVLGTSDPEAQMALARGFTLNGVVDKLTCPLLVMHGASDRQMPTQQAIWTTEQATSAKSVELKLFGPDDWGDQHCQHDDPTLAIDYMADWLAAVL